MYGSQRVQCGSSSLPARSSRCRSGGAVGRWWPDGAAVWDGAKAAVWQVQASYIGPNGKRQYAPETFKRKGDATRWLSLVEADLARGTWADDQLGRETFGNYARAWLRDHTSIGPRYRETCLRNLRLHLAPLDDVPLRALTPATVREWHAAALRGPGGKTSIAQSYRFVRAVLYTAGGVAAANRGARQGHHAPIPRCRPTGRVVWAAPRGDHQPAPRRRRPRPRHRHCAA